MNNPHTLLTKMFGVHRVKPHKKPEVHFLIFGSVFFNSKYIHKTFDLKGSSQGRSASEAEKKLAAPVFKVRILFPLCWV
jgi:1-phosphatidylinositol-4-phosphate 5-kinase